LVSARRSPPTDLRRAPKSTPRRQLQTSSGSWRRRAELPQRANSASYLLETVPNAFAPLHCT
jgi:hypothetical protein